MDMEAVFCDFLRTTPECALVWQDLLKEEKVVDIVRARRDRDA